MSEFVVSARKYRPNKLEDVIGQSIITSTLQNAINNNQVAQSFLFCGPRGVGKTSCARIFAKEINNYSENEINDFSFNIFELDAASNNSVEDIRNLTEQVRIPPQSGKYKVYIIDEAHMLSTQAFNAFLKTLEEPPPHAKFILATTEKNKIIPTILSRCQIFDFRRINIDDISNHLEYIANQENIIFEKEALNLIANKSDGSLRDALSLFDMLISYSQNEITYSSVVKHLNLLDYEYYFKITDNIEINDLSSNLLILNEIFENGFDGEYFLQGFSSHFRDLLVSKNNDTIFLIEKGSEIKKKYKEKSARFSPESLIKALDICNDGETKYNSVQNKRLLIEFVLLKIHSINDIEKKNDFLEKDIPNHKKTVTQKQSINNQSNATNQKEDGGNETAVLNSQKKEIDTEKLAEQKMYLNNLEEKKLKTVSNNEVIKIDKLQSKTFSISEQLDKLNKKDDIDINVIKNNTNIRFDALDLQKCWTSIIDDFKSKQKNNIAIILSSNNPMIKNDNEINIFVNNLSHIELIEDEKYTILNYLKEKLSNTNINLNIEMIKEENKEKIPYTNTDKFNKMIESNPLLNELRLNLGLDPDY
ncbi:MAG: DNA polymerase III, subunit gamma and tau [Flavobacteriales bacterium]|nr:DNA polymerase III, subunit gamma and tau [Flavobacteriales bacterium]